MTAGVFAWQRALHVAARDLPEPVRYTLTVLALFMDADGRNARPGLARLVAARGKSERTLRTHLEQAAAAGWLRLVQRGGRAGDGTVRASVYAAVFPAEVFERLDELLAPAWGDAAGPLPVEAQDGVSTGDPGLPVEAGEGPISTGSALLPVEDSSTGNSGLPVEPISTGNLSASTGNAALPPTDPSHRRWKEGSIDQRAQERAAARWLRARYGAATSDRVIAEVCAVAWDRAARAGEPVRNLVRYLDGWKEGDLVDVLIAAQAAEDAQQAAERASDSPAAPQGPGGPSGVSARASGRPAVRQAASGAHRTVAEAIAAATLDHDHSQPRALPVVAPEPSLTAVPGPVARRAPAQTSPSVRQTPLLTSVDGDGGQYGLPAAERAALRDRLNQIRSSKRPPAGAPRQAR